MTCSHARRVPADFRLSDPPRLQEATETGRGAAGAAEDDLCPVIGRPIHPESTGLYLPVMSANYVINRRSLYTYISTAAGILLGAFLRRFGIRTKH